MAQPSPFSDSLPIPSALQACCDPRTGGQNAVQCHLIIVSNSRLGDRPGRIFTGAPDILSASCGKSQGHKTSEITHIYPRPEVDPEPMVFSLTTQRICNDQEIITSLSSVPQTVNPSPAEMKCVLPAQTRRLTAGTFPKQYMLAVAARYRAHVLRY
jgi:hypothetical protein